MDPSRQGFRLIVATLLAVLAVAAASMMQATPFYPNIVILAPSELRATFLHQGRLEKAQCEADVENIVTTIKSKCAICQILEQRCVDKLDPYQRRMLYAAPLELPAARLPDGVVTFGSEDPIVALAACKESERQASIGPIGSIVECHSP